MSRDMGRFYNDSGILVRWPKKFSEREPIVAALAEKFAFGAVYHEREVNELLKLWHTFNDWAMLRRELVDRGYLKRDRDGTEYRRLK